MSRDKPLQVVIVNGEKVNTERVCYIPVSFGQGICHVTEFQVV